MRQLGSSKIRRRSLLRTGAAATGFAAAGLLPAGGFAQAKTQTVNLQLGWLAGYCHPIRFNDLVKSGKVPQAMLDRLPPAAAYEATYPFRLKAAALIADDSRAQSGARLGTLARAFAASMAPLAIIVAMAALGIYRQTRRR